MHEKNSSLISALCWLQSINSRADDRWNRCQSAVCSPLVSVSSVLSSVLTRERMGGEELTSLIRRKILKHARRSKLLSRLTFC